MPSFSMPEFPFTFTTPAFLQNRNIPLPLPMFFLTCGSLIGAFITLLVSLLDLGIFSLWLNPPLSLITLMYHCGALLIARRKRTPGNPSYFSTVVFTAYTIAIVWFVAFIITIVVLVDYKGDYKPATLAEKHGLPVSNGTQALQVFLTLYEFSMLGGIAITGHIIAWNEGEPDSWRPESREEIVEVKPGVVQETWHPDVEMQQASTPFVNQHWRGE